MIETYKMQMIESSMAKLAEGTTPRISRDLFFLSSVDVIDELKAHFSTDRHADLDRLAEMHTAARRADEASRRAFAAEAVKKVVDRDEEQEAAFGSSMRYLAQGETSSERNA